MTVTFEREQHTRRGDKPLQRETMVIEVEHDGLTRVRINGSLCKMKANRRALAYRLACQASAYYGLTDSVDGFPPQELL